MLPVCGRCVLLQLFGRARRVIEPVVVCGVCCVCSGRNEAADAADRERFLQELEEDAEMRARIALFKDPAALAAAAAGGNAMAETEDSDGDGDLPQVIDGSACVHC